jgi:hypothetical protein
VPLLQLVVFSVDLETDGCQHLRLQPQLEIAQLHYKRATQEVTDRLTDVDSSTDTLVLALLNEVSEPICAQERR